MKPQNRTLIDMLDNPLERLSPDALRVRLEGASRLLDAARLLAAESDERAVLDTIGREACVALRCAAARVYRYDAERNELVAMVATEQGAKEIRCGIGEGLIGHVARSHEMIHIANPAHDPRYSEPSDHLTDQPTSNLLAAPLLTPRDDTLLGVLQLLNRDGGPFDELDRQILQDFCRHAAIAIDRTRLFEQLRHRRATEASLEVARGIQRGFMPRRTPSIPGYECATWWMATDAVGGDYCDLIPLKDHRFGLAVADVSGHGLGPSLIMAAVRAALHALVLEYSEPEVLLNLLGRSLSGDLGEDRFITMILAVLDPVDHSIQYANAGQAPVLHFEAATREFFQLESTGMPIGVVDTPHYHQGWPLTVEAGDLLVLATDGIVEAMDRHDRKFGRERLEAILRKTATLPVDEMARQIGEAVQNHYEGTNPPDDLTILLVRRNR
ncbi:MAG: PP2C family protein-serine/threonine phosphatase [Pirellulales bacterium]